MPWPSIDPKLFWTGPNNLGPVQISLDRSKNDFSVLNCALLINVQNILNQFKTIWTGPKPFQTCKRRKAKFESEHEFLKTQKVIKSFHLHISWYKMEKLQHFTALLSQWPFLEILPNETYNVIQGMLIFGRKMVNFDHSDVVVKMYRTYITFLLNYVCY